MLQIEQEKSLFSESRKKIERNLCWFIKFLNWFNKHKYEKRKIFTQPRMIFLMKFNFCWRSWERVAVFKFSRKLVVDFRNASYFKKFMLTRLFLPYTWSQKEYIDLIQFDNWPISNGKKPHSSINYVTKFWSKHPLCHTIQKSFHKPFIKHKKV